MIDENQIFNFFLVCPPGFEDSLANELTHLGLSDHKLEKGGIEVSANLKTGFELNQQIRIASKILLRLKSFTARDFPKLHSQITKIEWRRWLWSEKVDFHISTKESRLIHSGRIGESALKAIEKALKSQPAKLKTQFFFDFNPQVYINIRNDLAIVSIDTSHPPLYIRTKNKVTHPASLRENLAFGCWSKLLSHLPNSLANNDSIELVDPMCGSATFLLESLQLEPTRSYSYQGFPCYQYQPKYKQKASSCSIPIPMSLYGLDIDKNTIDLNSKHYKDHPIKWQTQDLMQQNSLDQHISPVKRLLITNPPYNKRLKVSMNMKEMLKAMITQYKPDLLGVIIPNDQISQIKDIHADYKELEQVRFKNGGIPCSFVIWKSYALEH